MGGIAFLILVLIAAPLTWMVIVIFDAMGIILHPLWTFLAIFLGLVWLGRRL